MNTIPIYLRAWRLAQGRSQSQLCQISGLRQATISSIEAGKTFPHSSTLAQLAQALDIQPTDLFRPVSPPPSRHLADRLAKAIVSGKYPRDPKQRQLCQDFALWVGEKLKAQGAPGWQNIKGKRLHSIQRSLWMKQTYPQAVRNQILWRMNKLFAARIYES